MCEDQARQARQEYVSNTNKSKRPNMLAPDQIRNAHRVTTHSRSFLFHSRYSAADIPGAIQRQNHVQRRVDQFQRGDAHLLRAVQRSRSVKRAKDLTSQIQALLPWTWARIDWRQRRLKGRKQHAYRAKAMLFRAPRHSKVHLALFQKRGGIRKFPAERVNRTYFFSWKTTSDVNSPVARDVAMAQHGRHPAWRRGVYSGPVGRSTLPATRRVPQWYRRIRQSRDGGDRRAQSGWVVVTDSVPQAINTRRIQPGGGDVQPFWQASYGWRRKGQRFQDRDG